MLSTSSSISKLKTEVDQLDDLVKSLLNQAHQSNGDAMVNAQPLSTATSTAYAHNHQSNKDSSIEKPYETSSTLNRAKANEFDSSSDGITRTKMTREERIRIKRGTGMNIPVTNLSSSTITKTSNKPNISSSIDEQLIDSLLESVQSTLRRRAQQASTTASMYHDGRNRRAHSSSSSYADTIHRVS
jgi:hypothetical protein